MTENPCFSRKRIISFPDGRGRLGNGELFEAYFERSKSRRRIQAPKGVIKAVGLDVNTEGLFEVCDGSVFGLSFPVCGHVRNAGGKASKFRIGNELNGNLFHAMTLYQIGLHYQTET